MGIRLDWEVEADNRRIRGKGEDPDAKRRRRTAYVRVLMTIGIVLALGAGAVLFVVDRIQDANNEIEQILRDTVEAEVTALRIGDRVAFERVQRSASDAWIEQQRTLFGDYQELLRMDPTLQLTGTILDVEIDDPRARVTVQEIQGGVPYTRLWFYYRFEEDTDNPPDGIADSWQWYHVPPDTEFWGESATLTGDAVTVDYEAVDADLAESMQAQLDGWLATACTALPCDTLPTVTVTITSDDLLETAWSPVDPWQLLVESPLRERLRTDMPFDPDMRVEVASLLAVRLATFIRGGAELTPTTDAHYFQNEAIVPWLVGQFLQVNTGETVIDSLAQNYGRGVIGDVLQALTPDATVSVLTQVTGVPLDQLNIDWRDYFTWRLRLEQQLIAEGLGDAVAALYDTTDTAAIQAANARIQGGTSGLPFNVIVVRPAAPAADGSPQLAATYEVGSDVNVTVLETVFRLRDGTWKRAN